MRRILIIASSIIVILGLGAVAYIYFFSTTPSVEVTPTPTFPSAGSQDLPQAVTPVTQTEPATTARTIPRLVQITKDRVVPGVIVVDTVPVNASSTSDTIVRYIDRQSGNVYAYSQKTAGLSRIANKTIPGIQSAVWLPDGSTAYAQYLSGTTLSTINTYALSAVGGTGFFLPQNIQSISVASSTLLTLASGVNGSVGSVSRTDGAGTQTAFTTPLASARASFAGKGRYLVYTKAAATLAGGAFIYTSPKQFTRIAGPHFGLSALASPLGKWVLISYVEGGAMRTKLVNTTTVESIDLPVGTIADKCVWSADESNIYCGVPVNASVNATYPDDWYQGAYHFSDRIWRISVTGRYAELILDFTKETKTELDAEALAVNPLGTVLVFVNRNDGSLWSYAL